MATIYTSKSGFNANYVFTISGVTVVPVFGATYTNNSQTFTVVGANTSGTPGSITGYLFCTAGGAPTASGTLTKTGGTGDATITFSAYQTSGASYTASFLTIQAGSTAAGSGGTVIVGSGLYNEKVTGQPNSQIWYMDGVVVMDGTGIAGTGAALPSNYITIGPYTNGGWLIVQNMICTTLAGGAQSVNQYYTNVVFLSNSNTTAISISTSAALNLNNCVFSGFTTPILDANGGTATLAILNCTFYNGATAITAAASTVPTINNTIFSNFTTAWNVSSVNSINNNIYYTITNWKVGASTYTSQVTLQTAGYDLNSLWQNPNFVDPANNVFYLTSNPNTSSNQFLYYGAYPYGFTRGAANNPDLLWNITALTNNSGWWNPDGNAAKDGATGWLCLNTGNFVFVVSGITTAPTAGATYTNNTFTYTVTSTNLYGTAGNIYGTVACTGTGLPTNTGNLTKSGGTGDANIAFSNGIQGAQIYSPVIDLGSAQSIKQIGIAATQTPPASMVDMDATDTKPNYQTSEFRTAGYAFTQNDGVVSWVTVKQGLPFATPLAGRFCQLRITLRLNDVAG